MMGVIVGVFCRLALGSPVAPFLALFHFGGSLLKPNTRKMGALLS